MKASREKTARRDRRHARVRARVSGTMEIPRLSVFRSNQHVYAQIIDDTSGKTIVASSDVEMKEAAKKPLTEKAKLVGADIAKKAGAKSIKKVVFDKGWFRYMGAVANLADAARAGGLTF